MIDEAGVYLSKAEEALAGADSEYAHQRYNNCANRSYYACFQAGVAALLRAGIRPPSTQWGHDFVQAEFAGRLVARRKVYPPEVRDTLLQAHALRLAGDYGRDHVPVVRTVRVLQRAHVFVDTIKSTGGSSR